MTLQRSSSIRDERRPRFPAVLFFIMLTAASSRGFLEIMLDKTAAYAVQVALVSVFTVYLLLAGRPRPGRRFALALMFSWFFTVVALLSLFASLNISGVDYAGIFVGVMLFFVAILVIFGQLDFSFANGQRVGWPVAVVACLLMVTAWLQQWGNVTLLPGVDRGTFGGGAAGRPSSLTGSFLHYPVLLAMLSFVLVGLYTLQKRMVYLVVAVVGMLSVVASFSRSGIVIICVGFATALLLAKRTSTRVRGIGAIVLGVVVAVVALPTNPYLDRFLSIFDIQGAGNSTRLFAWESIIRLWLDSPLVIGSHTGQYTNVTSNLSSADASGVAESGVLQQLISFGLLGAIAFYGVMVLSVAATPISSPWFRAGLVGGIAQSVFYQSIEVLPFMVAFSLVPFIARQAIGVHDYSSLAESDRHTFTARPRRTV